MVIGFLRHYKVDHKWKNFCYANDFIDECIKYDHAPIILQENRIETDYDIYISDLKRSYDTAKSIFSEKDFNSTKLLNEVTISPFTKIKLKLPTTLWMLIGRLHWNNNNITQKETKKYTTKKMEQLLTLLEEKKSNCILVGHGFFFYEFSKFLENRNYTRNGNRRLKNGEYAEYTLNNA